MNGAGEITITSQVAELHLEEANKKRGDKPYETIKRIGDIFVSAIVLLLLSPIFLIIAVLIKLDSKGPAFYKHKRLGKNGQFIYLYKFRTMVTNGDEILKNLPPELMKEWKENYKLKHDPRITKIGHILRKTSLDELPQVLNILKGDMSVVGPRPVIEEEVKKYAADRDKFLSVTPGLTGWWACNGRSCTSYEDRKKLELYYVDNKSLRLDLKIVMKTFVTVFKRDGAE